MSEVVYVKAYAHLVVDFKVLSQLGIHSKAAKFPLSRIFSIKKSVNLAWELFKPKHA
jgi:hypothetical protein